MNGVTMRVSSQFSCYLDPEFLGAWESPQVKDVFLNQYLSLVVESEVFEDRGARLVTVER